MSKPNVWTYRVYFRHAYMIAHARNAREAVAQILKMRTPQYGYVGYNPEFAALVKGIRDFKTDIGFIRDWLLEKGIAQPDYIVQGVLRSPDDAVEQALIDYPTRMEKHLYGNKSPFSCIYVSLPRRAKL